MNGNDKEEKETCTAFYRAVRKEGANVVGASVLKMAHEALAPTVGDPLAMFKKSFASFLDREVDRVSMPYDEEEMNMCRTNLCAPLVVSCGLCPKGATARGIHGGPSMYGKCVSSYRRHIEHRVGGGDNKVAHLGVDLRPYCPSLIEDKDLQTWLAKETRRGPGAPVLTERAFQDLFRSMFVSLVLLAGGSAPEGFVDGSSGSGGGGGSGGGSGERRVIIWTQGSEAGRALVGRSPFDARLLPIVPDKPDGAVVAECSMLYVLDSSYIYYSYSIAAYGSYRLLGGPYSSASARVNNIGLLSAQVHPIWR